MTQDGAGSNEDRSCEEGGRGNVLNKLNQVLGRALKEGEKAYGFNE